MRKPVTPPVSLDQEKMPAPAPRTRKRTKTVLFSHFDAKRRRTESDMNDVVKKLNCTQCKKNDKAEMLIHCIEEGCTSKIHLSCLQSIQASFGKNGEQSWRCYNCQFCSTCKKGVIKGTNLLQCYVCFNYFHSKCIGAENKIQIVEKNRFRCDSCEKNEQTTKERGIMTSGRLLRKKTVLLQRNTTKPVKKQVTVTSRNNDSSRDEEDYLGFNTRDLQRLPTNIIRRSKSAENLVDKTSKNQQSSSGNNHCNSVDVTSIPDAYQWSTNQVYEYFKEIFPRHAHVFEEEDIDGRTLYLLQREDITRGFKIKLGPSLRMYHHIMRIQKKNQSVPDVNRRLADI